MLKMIYLCVKQEYPTSPIALICIYIDHFIIYYRLKPNFGLGSTVSNVTLFTDEQTTVSKSEYDLNKLIIGYKS
jgi:hypothetical protein